MVKFTLVKRRPRSQGHRAIYYCRIRTDDGRSVSWRSTGEWEKPKALLWAMRRLKTAAFSQTTSPSPSSQKNGGSQKANGCDGKRQGGGNTAPGIWKAIE